VRCSVRTSNLQVSSLDDTDDPFVRFVFRYRPPALLQAEGIISQCLPSRIPRTAPSKAHMTTCAAESSTSAIPVKRERQDNEERVIFDLTTSEALPPQIPFKKIKMGDLAKKPQCRAKLQPTVIDLTED